MYTLLGWRIPYGDEILSEDYQEGLVADLDFCPGCRQPLPSVFLFFDQTDL
jgi:hypothetical protein